MIVNSVHNKSGLLTFLATVTHIFPVHQYSVYTSAATHLCHLVVLQNNGYNLAGIFQKDTALLLKQRTAEGYGGRSQCQKWPLGMGRCTAASYHTSLSLGF